MNRIILIIFILLLTVYSGCLDNDPSIKKEYKVIQVSQFVQEDIIFYNVYYQVSNITYKVIMSEQNDYIIYSNRTILVDEASNKLISRGILYLNKSDIGKVTNV